MRLAIYFICLALVAAKEDSATRLMRIESKGKEGREEPSNKANAAVDAQANIVSSSSPEEANFVSSSVEEVLLEDGEEVPKAVDEGSLTEKDVDEGKTANHPLMPTQALKNNGFEQWSIGNSPALPGLSAPTYSQGANVSSFRSAIPTSKQSSSSGSSFSITAWIQWDNFISITTDSAIACATGTACGTGVSASEGFSLKLRRNSYVLAAGFNNGYQITGVTTTVQGQWYHVAFVFTGTTEYLYLNGASEGSATASFTRRCTIYLGSCSTPFGNAWSGQIGNLQLWPSALTAQQVAALSLGSFGLPQPSYVSGVNISAFSSVSTIGQSTGSLRLQYSSMSITAWIYGTSWSNNRCIAGALDTGCTTTNMGLFFQVLTNGKLRAGFTDDTITGVTTLVPSRWYHVAFVFDQGTMKNYLYVNTVLDKTESSRGALNSTTCNIYVGTCSTVPNLSGAWAGQVSQVSIYGLALGQAHLSVMVYGYGGPSDWSGVRPTSWAFASCTSGATTGANGLGSSSYPPASEGLSYAVLSGNGCSIAQDFGTKSGVRYAVRFEARMSTWTDSGMGICVQVSPLQNSNLSVPVLMYTTDRWTVMSYNFVPERTRSTITFSICNGTNIANPKIYLDGVVITEDAPIGPISRDGCQASDVKASMALNASYVGIFPYNNIFCHRRRWYTGKTSDGLPDTECSDGGFSSGYCLPNLTYSSFVPGVPKECASNGNRRRALDSDAWPVRPSWEDVECSHRRRDSRRRQLVPSTGKLLANDTVVYPGSTPGPHVFTLGLYMEGNGRMFHVGENQFNGRFQSNDDGIIMRTCDTCSPSWQTIYYRRFTNISRFNPFYTFACGWNSPSFNPSATVPTFSNVCGVDYALFSNLQDAMDNNVNGMWNCARQNPPYVNAAVSCPQVPSYAGFPGSMGPICQSPGAQQWMSIPLGSCTAVVPSGPGGLSGTGATVAFWILEDAALVQARKPQAPNPVGMVAWFKSENAGPVWKSAVSHHVAFTMAGNVASLVGSSGENAWISNPSNGFALSYGASMPVVYISGSTSEQFTFGTILSDTMSLCSITRYIDTAVQGRILLGSDTNLLHGHWQGFVGAVYYDTWMTAPPQPSGGTVAGISAAVSPTRSTTGLGSTNWLVLCSARRAPIVYDNSQNVGIQQLHAAQGLSINQGGCCWTTDQSNWAVMEVIAWNRTLSKVELSLAGAYLQWKLEAGTSRAPAGRDPYPIMPPELPQKDNLEAWYKNADMLSENGFLSSWVDKVHGYTVNVTASSQVAPFVEQISSNGSNDSGVSSNSVPVPPLAVISDSAVSYGAATLLGNVLYGTVQQMVDFGPVLKHTYTICSVTRYTGPLNQGTILVSSNGDIHGHWNSRVGVANYGTVWRTQQWQRNIGSKNWLIFCGSNAGGPVLDGTADVSVNKVDTRATNYDNPFMTEVDGSDYHQLSEEDHAFYMANTQHLQINSAATTALSDFAVFEVAVWNTNLTLAEMRNVASYYMYVLKYGVGPY